MGLALSIATYFVVWWITLFAVLPFGVHTQEEDGEIVPGTPESAPAKFRMWRMLLVNTVVSTVVFAAIWFTVYYLKLEPADLPPVPQ